MTGGTSISDNVRERISATVIRSEGDAYGGGPGQSHRAVIVMPSGTLEAIVTTPITAASGTTYGTGAAQIYIDSSGAGISDGAYPNPVTVLNWYTGSGTVANGTHIFISYRNGGYRLVGADC